MNQLIILAQWIKDAPVGYKLTHLTDGLFEGGGNHVAGLLAAAAVVAFLATRSRSGESAPSSGWGTKLAIAALIAFVLFYPTSGL